MINKTDNNLFVPDFDEIKSNIFLCPAEEGWDIHDSYLLYPSFDACGLTWNFTMPSQDGNFQILVSKDIMEAWGVTSDILIQAFQMNIQRYLNDVSYTLLFGGEEGSLTVPLLKVYFANNRKQPPYGISLMLSDEFISKMHLCIGDFIGFPVNINYFYIIPREIVEKCNKNSMHSLLNILQNIPEEKPMFFKSRPLFEEEEIIP